MSDNVDKPVEEGLEDSAPPATSRTTDKKALRRKTFKFVFVFVVSVFLLLYGYESIRRSMPNDWYLLQVASSTTFLLKHVGYSCELGSAERFKGREAAVREGLAAWARGEEPPKLPPSDPVQALSGSERPLTAWEAWKYQGLMYRLGIRDAERELARIKSDANLAEPQRSQQIKGVETQLHR